MALSATLFRFEIGISDVDRGVYESLALRVAQHPSETDLYLVTRVLARVLEHRDGLAFGKGLSDPDAAPISALRDAGIIALWVDIGHPKPERLHKASKRADEVCVYTHRAPASLLADLASAKIHRADEIRVVALEPDFIADLAERLSRINRWDMLRSDGVLYVTVDDETLTTTPLIHEGRAALE